MGKRYENTSVYVACCSIADGGVWVWREADSAAVTAPSQIGSIEPSLIVSVQAFVANRQLAGYDFSPDGERAYLLKLGGGLEIKATRTRELEASIQVSRYIRGGASEVIASPRPDQIVLMGGRRWVVLDLGLEL